jgi:hypothetical protein
MYAQKWMDSKEAQAQVSLNGLAGKVQQPHVMMQAMKLI